MKTSHIFRLYLVAFFGITYADSAAQMITGVWTGKINRQRVELKIIQRGDSLTGTSYYGSPSQYRRYRIKGYFDATSNEVVWWDDQLVEQKPATGKGLQPLLSRADFNCPGGGVMTLDGKSGKTHDEPSGDVQLSKTDHIIFHDEWDDVIENYTTGGNDPFIIDSIESLRPLTPVLTAKPPEKNVTEPVRKPTGMVAIVPPRAGIKTVTPIIPQTIEEKFSSRKKTFVTEIPLSGDSIELRFYDNAEIDGDSISLFLDGNLLYRNIRLTGNAYAVRLSVNDLSDNSELVMVAENLGSIPPNTSLMVAIVGDNRYEARLESTEGSSAMILFRKPAKISRQ